MNSKIHCLSLYSGYSNLFKCDKCNAIISYYCFNIKKYNNSWVYINNNNCSENLLNCDEIIIKNLLE